MNRLFSTEVSVGYDQAKSLPTFASSTDITSGRKCSGSHDSEKARSANIPGETPMLPYLDSHCTPLTTKHSTSIASRPKEVANASITENRHLHQGEEELGGLTNTTSCSLITTISCNSNKEPKTELTRSTSFRSNAISSQSDGAVPSKRGSVRLTRPSFRKRPVNQTEVTPSSEMGSGLLQDSHSSTHNRQAENRNDTIRGAKEALRRRAVPLSGPVRGSSFYKSSTSAARRAQQGQPPGAAARLQNPPENVCSSHVEESSSSCEHHRGTMPSPRAPVQVRMVESTFSASPESVAPMLDTPLDRQRSRGHPGLVEMLETSLSAEAVCSGTSPGQKGSYHSESDSDADSDDMVSRHQKRVTHRLQCLTQRNSEEPKSGRHYESLESPNDGSGSTSRSCNVLGGAGISVHSEFHVNGLRCEKGARAWLHPTFAEDVEDAEASATTGGFTGESIFKPLTATSSGRDRSLWNGFGTDDCSTADFYARLRKKVEVEETGEIFLREQSQSAISDNRNASPEEPSTTRLVSVPESVLEPHPPAEEKSSRAHFRDTLAE